MTPWWRAERVAAVALTFAAVATLLELFAVGSWQWQILFHRAAGPPMVFVAAWLAHRAIGRAELPGARRHWRLMSLALTIVGVGDVITLVVTIGQPVAEFPLFSPVIQGLYLTAVTVAVIAIMSIPQSVPWTAGRLRFGLDMVTVLLGGAVFLWYFSIAPIIGRSAGVLPVLSSSVQAIGVLVTVFVVSRVILTGADGVRRGALVVLGLGGVIEVVAEAFIPVLERGDIHITLAMTGLFRILLVLGPLVQLLAATPSSQPAARPRGTFSMLPFAAVAATDTLLVVAFAHGPRGQVWAVLAGALVLTGLVVVRQIVALRDNTRLVDRLNDSLGSLRQAMAREQVLAELGTSLMTARENDDIRRLTVDSAARLVASCPDGAATIVTPGADPRRSWRILIASGDDAGEFAGAEVTAPALPDELIARLLGGDVVDANPVALGVSTAGTATQTQSVVLLPLVAAGRFFGVLTVSARDRIPPDVRKCLETLRTQAALALEGALLTAELTEQATHDPLTGLANRTLIRRHLERALSRARRDGGQVGALLLDLNGFKQINDEYGHETGDDVLRAVAHRLARCVRGDDPTGRAGTGWDATAVAGRLGGDEFVILVENLVDPRVATLIADRVTAALTQPIAVGDRELYARASIGIALSGPAVHNPDQILRLADAAMYEAKREAKRSAVPI